MHGGKLLAITGSMKKRFRDALIAALEGSGMSRRELAEAVGISKSQIDKICQREDASTKVEDAAAIADYFGCTLDEFMGASPDFLGKEYRDLLAKLPENERQFFLRQLKGAVEGL